MNTEKRRKFIIDATYVAIILLISLVVLRYGLPLLAPFVLAFLIAYLLKRPIHAMAARLRLPRKGVAVVTVLVFYGTIGVVLALLSVKAFAVVSTFVMELPNVYTTHVAPVLTDIFAGVERSTLLLDPSLLSTLEELWGQFIQSLGQLVSSLSVKAMSAVSGVASSLPGLFIKLLLLIISTFFITVDYDRLTGFCLRQMSEKVKAVFFQIKEYVIGTLFVCIRSYLVIMSLTFVELAIGLSIIGIEQSVLIALLIAAFDILPVLGTGGIMIPWTILTALQGNYSRAFGLLAVYLAVTVIRNILEPKIVGSQIGLHPVVTLAGIFVGAQLFGVLGLFGVPIGLSLLRHLNDTGTIHLLKPDPAEEAAQAAPGGK